MAGRYIAASATAPAFSSSFIEGRLMPARIVTTVSGQRSFLPQYGRTVADALHFLGSADHVSIAVRVGRGRHTYWLIPVDQVITALAQSPPGEPMPCHYEHADRHVFIGSVQAIERAEQP